MENHHGLETGLRLFCGGVLWAVSGLLTTGLFLALAGENLAKKIVLVALALGLEGAKILMWRMGRGYRLLAISLLILSGLASLGAALETVEAYRQSRSMVTVSDSPRTAAIQQEVLVLDRQIDVLLDRQTRLPADYVTANREMTAEIDRLRGERSKYVETSLPIYKDNPTIFDLLARALGLPTETLLLALLLFLSFNLEAAALVLADPGTKVGQAPTGPACTAQDFLEAAMDGAPLPLLHGRDTTAKKLGISGYLAKKLVAELRHSGAIRVSGKRLVLNSEP